MNETYIYIILPFIALLPFLILSTYAKYEKKKRREQRKRTVTKSDRIPEQRDNPYENQYENYRFDATLRHHQKVTEEYFARISPMIFNLDFEPAEIAIREKLEEYYNLCDYSNPGAFLAMCISSVYMMRDKDPFAEQFTLLLCHLDMERWDMAKQHGEYCNYIQSPKRMAIILKKRGEYDGAIAACDWAIERGIIDTGQESFVARKEQIIRLRDKEIQQRKRWGI